MLKSSIGTAESSPLLVNDFSNSSKISCKMVKFSRYFETEALGIFKATSLAVK